MRRITFEFPDGFQPNAEGFCDTSEQIGEDIEEMNAREDECEVAK